MSRVLRSANAFLDCNNGYPGAFRGIPARKDYKNFALYPGRGAQGCLDLTGQVLVSPRYIWVLCPLKTFPFY